VELCRALWSFMEPLRYVMEHYGSVAEHYGSVTEPLRKILILPIINSILKFAHY